MKTAWKIFYKYNNGLYSLLLCLADADGYDLKKTIKKLKKYIIFYKKNNWNDGKPWIALFRTKKQAQEFIGTANPITYQISKVEYVPYNKNDKSFKFCYYECILKKDLSVHRKDLIPKGTIFASKIRIIK